MTRQRDYRHAPRPCRTITQRLAHDRMLAAILEAEWEALDACLDLHDNVFRHRAARPSPALPPSS